MEMRIDIPRGTPLFGVDVGNGYGKVSILLAKEKDPVTLLPESLRSGMPSTAYVAPDGTISVYGARNRTALRAVGSVKTRLREEYILMEEPNGRSYQVSPCDVYAAIARDLVKLANSERRKRGEEPVYQLVLTYPADFRHQPALLGKLKNSVESVILDDHPLQVCGMLSEPAAVAVDYLYYMRNLAENPITAEKYTVLVYDLGHGTFDTAVVTAYAQSDKDYDLICQDGDPEIGGRKFDELLFDELCAQIRNTAKGKASFDRESLRRLAVEMKHDLSRSTISEKDFLGGDEEVLLSITQEQFENLISLQIGKTLELVQGMLDEAAQKHVTVNAIVLSGGSSQIPLVKKALLAMTSNELPVDIYRPTLGVTYGAARAAHGLYTDDSGEPVSPVITQHCERSCGIRDHDRVFFMLNEDSELPCVSEPVPFISSNTGRTEIQLRRARNRMPGKEQASYDDCVDILRMYMDLPPKENCSLTLRMDANRCIYVDCTLANGSTITKSTFQYKEQEQ